MQLLSFLNHVLDQRGIEPHNSKSIAIVSVRIVAELCPLQKAEDDTVLLPDQRVPDAVQGQGIPLIAPVPTPTQPIWHFDVKLVVSAVMKSWRLSHATWLNI